MSVSREFVIEWLYLRVDPGRYGSILTIALKKCLACCQVYYERNLQT
jgi:hypothetical protein